MEFKGNVQKLQKKCKAFLDEVKFIGNECAYTDRMLEEILDEAEVLKTKYSNSFK